MWVDPRRAGVAVVRLTRHYVDRAIERGISQAEVREVLQEVEGDTPFGRGARELLASGQTVTIRRRGVALVLAGSGADVRIVTTFRPRAP